MTGSLPIQEYESYERYFRALWIGSKSELFLTWKRATDPIRCCELNSFIFIYSEKARPCGTLKHFVRNVGQLRVLPIVKYRE